MMKVIAALLTLLCVASTSSAQTFTERLQRKVAGKGKVTVVHSAAIDKLVNGNQPDATPTKPKPVTPADTDKKATTHNEATKTHTEATKTHTVATKTHTEATKTDASKDDFDIPTVDMRKKVMARSYKVNGYRVQAFAGGNSRTDRQKAQNIGDAIKMQFPEQPVYVHFYSPRWICRVGNYRTYEEAHAMLLELKKMGYQQATIVKGKISVQY